jgi:methionyl aminopeptidase
MLTCSYVSLTLCRARERSQNEELYDSVRHAAEVHRQVRHHAQSFIKPGIKLVDMCEQIEECNRRLVKENGLEVRWL